MARFGSQVTVFAKSGEVLRKEDRDAAELVQQQLKADGVVFRLNCHFHLISNGGPGGREIHIQLGKTQKGDPKVTYIFQGNSAGSMEASGPWC